MSHVAGARFPRLADVRFRASSLAYTLSLAAIVFGFGGYWALWKFKIYIAGWVLAAMIVAVFALDRRLEARGLAHSVGLVLLWFGYLALTASWSPDARTTLVYAGSHAVLLTCAYVVGYLWLRNVSAWKLSTYFVVQAVILLPLVAGSLATTGRFYDEARGSIRTGLAASMLMALPFLIWRARTRPSFGRIALLTLAVLLLAGSGSRSGPVIGLLALFASVAFVQRPRKQRLKGLVAATAGVAFLVGLAATVPQVRAGASEGLSKLKTETALDRSGWTEPGQLFTPSGELAIDVERRVQAIVALQSFLSHPIRGGGYYSTYAITRDWWAPVGAHGLPSVLLGETGLVGAVIFLWLLLRFFRGTSFAKRRSASLTQQGFWETSRLTMIVILLFGIFHQVDQIAQFFVLLSWGHAARFETDR